MTRGQAGFKREGSSTVRHPPRGPVPPPAKGVGGQEKTEKLPKYGSANKS